jgi:predicted RNA-binding protein with PUA-like domain
VNLALFSIQDLALRSKASEPWDGVRNYQARNYLKQMRLHDHAFFYHSNCKEPGIYGVMQIINTAYPDPSALNPESPYFDPKSSPEKPRWFMVNVKLISIWPQPLLLAQLKKYAALNDCPLLRRGNRLSVMPIEACQWAFIEQLRKLL